MSIFQRGLHVTEVSKSGFEHLRGSFTSEREKC